MWWVNGLILTACVSLTAGAIAYGGYYVGYTTGKTLGTKYLSMAWQHSAIEAGVAEWRKSRDGLIDLYWIAPGGSERVTVSESRQQKAGD